MTYTDDVQLCRRELIALVALNDDNVVRLLACDLQHRALVYEHVDGGDLGTYMRARAADCT